MGPWIYGAVPRRAAVFTFTLHEGSIIMISTLSRGRYEDRVLAVIPAGGGSKRSKRSNLATCLGKPLVMHSIEQALASRRVTDVIVSTDDDETASVAEQAGARVVRPPAELTGDDSQTEPVLVHTLREWMSGGGKSPSALVVLQPTSPRRSSQDIDAALDKFQRDALDSLFSACRLDGFVWTFEDGQPNCSEYLPELRPRKADMPARVIENGSIYVLRPRVLREYGARIGGSTGVLIQDPLASIRVESEEDIATIERLHAMDSPRADAMTHAA